LSELTPEEIVAAAIGLLVVIGGVTIVLAKLVHKLGFNKCPDECPDPECKNVVAETKTLTETVKNDALEARLAASKARDSIIVLQNDMTHVKNTLEQKRIKIEGLQTDTTEIKTDVKWIVKAIQAKNKL